MIRELLGHRELVFTLVKRDLKVRYKASALGFLWSFGRPLFLMLIMWAVFSKIVRIDEGMHIPYALHLLTGLLPWMFLQGSLFDSQGTFLANSNVVKKVSVPAGAFPLACVLSNLVHLVLAFGILCVFIAGYVFLVDPQLTPGWEVVFLPGLVLLQAAMLFGISLFVSSLNVFYRDTGSITEISVTAWFYLTPVIYPVQMAREELTSMFATDIVYYLYLCNPMTPIIVGYRRVLYGNHLRYAPEISDPTLLTGLAISAAFTAIVLVAGIRLFSRLSKSFADEL